MVSNSSRDFVASVGTSVLANIRCSWRGILGGSRKFMSSMETSPARATWIARTVLYKSTKFVSHISRLPNSSLLPDASINHRLRRVTPPLDRIGGGSPKRVHTLRCATSILHYSYPPRLPLRAGIQTPVPVVLFRSTVATNFARLRNRHQFSGWVRCGESRSMGGRTCRVWVGVRCHHLATSGSGD